jgi:hypothetical protein
VAKKKSMFLFCLMDYGSMVAVYLAKEALQVMAKWRAPRRMASSNW